MDNIDNLGKVRIHSQIGSIPELFYESKGDIHDLFRSGTHTSAKLRFALVCLMERRVNPMPDSSALRSSSNIRFCVYKRAGSFSTPHPSLH